MAKKRKRKINVRNVLILVIGLFLIIGTCILIPVYNNYKTQQARQELLEQKLTARQTYEETVKSASYTGTDQQAAEDFATIQGWAEELNKDTYTGLEELKDQKISSEQAGTLEALDPQTEGAKYVTVLQEASDMDPYWLRFLAKDDDRLTFVSEYNNQQAFQNPPAELSESLDTVPALLQWDQRWGYIPYGDMIIAFSGCAPTTLSMVLSYLNQDPSITPVQVAEFAEASGDYVIGAGTAYSIFDNAAAHYDVDVEGISVDMDSITQALNEGKVLIAHAVPGKFTTIGHFMVIVGVEDGKLIVHDPNSIKNTDTSWDPDEMLPEFDIIWGFSKPGGVQTGSQESDA